MKLLFWILAILSIPASLFVSFVCYLSHGLDLAGTAIGEVVFIAGMLSLIISIICTVVGIINLRKGNVKSAIVFVLMGIIYTCIIIGGYYLDDAVHTKRLAKDIAERNNQLYGENWNSPAVYDEIPLLYQEELNKFYVAVRDLWPSDQLMDLGAVSMSEYYGDASLDNIGFNLIDVNGDNSNELIIGTVSTVEEGGTAIFCIYSNPENPFPNITSTEGEIYYLHYGESDNTFCAEIHGKDAAWQFNALEGESIVDITYQECVLDPDNRLTLEMIPFSQYK